MEQLDDVCGIAAKLDEVAPNAKHYDGNTPLGFCRTRSIENAWGMGTLALNLLKAGVIALAVGAAVYLGAYIAGIPGGW